MYSPNLCKTMYLEQEQNIYGGGLITALSYIPVIAFYSMFYYYTVKFINYVNNTNDNENTEKKNNEEDNDEEFKKNYIYQFEDININIKLLNDVCLETETQNEIKKKQEVIENMLSTKTLERALVIYYIFIKKGNYKIIIKNEETNEYSFKEYNSYLEFKKYEDSQKHKETEGSIPSLDNSLEADTKFVIGEKEYNINEGILKMISWIYYSGLYEYLTTNIELKYKILKDMYNDNLLTSNLFLRYQLFLQENETLIEELEKSDDECEYDESDEDTNEEEPEEIKILYEKHNLCRNIYNKLHKNLEIINLEDNDLDIVTYSDSEPELEPEQEEPDEESDIDLEKINLENELEEIIMKDETSK